MGVSFIDLAEADRTRIQKLIDFHLKNAPAAKAPKASPRTSTRGNVSSGARQAVTQPGVPAVKPPPAKKK